MSYRCDVCGEKDKQGGMCGCQRSEQESEDTKDRIIHLERALNEARKNFGLIRLQHCREFPEKVLDCCNEAIAEIDKILTPVTRDGIGEYGVSGPFEKPPVCKVVNQKEEENKT